MGLKTVFSPQFLAFTEWARDYQIVDVLAALRGPDVITVSGLKRNTTTKIRAFVFGNDEAGLQTASTSGYWTYDGPISRETFREVRDAANAEEETTFHFRTHIHNAAQAILSWYDTPSGYAAWQETKDSQPSTEEV